MGVIEAERLCKSFAGRGPRGRRIWTEAVRDVSFSIDQGERIAYIGPNGAGKSTSIKMLTGILHPTRGEARVLEHVPWRQRRALARHIGTLFGQRSQLWFQLTARQTFELLGTIYGIDPDTRRRRVDELGKLLDAGELFEAPVRSLSLGQRMRCELAASLLHSPKVLFLDEPTIGLDLVAKQRFRELIVRLNEQDRTTIFLTSHDVADIEQVARRVLVINHGRIIYDDAVSRMRRSLLRTKLVDVRFEQEPTDGLSLPGLHVLKRAGVGYKLVVDTDMTSIRRVLNELLDKHHVADISVLDPPLEEIITRIYEESHP